MQIHSNTCNRIVNLRLATQLKGEKKNGAINLVKQSQHIILMPPVYLNFSTASKSLNLSSSDVPHRFHFHHCNFISASPRCNQIFPYQNPTQSPLLFYGLCNFKIYFVLAIKISLANREHLVSP